MKSSRSRESRRPILDVDFRREARFIKRWFLGWEDRVVNLKPTFFRKYKLWWVLAIFLVTFSVFAINKLFTRAEVADFYPATCLGSWQNPEKAQGKVDDFVVGGSGVSSSSFTLDNSAVYSSPEQKIFCGQLVPEDYQGKGEIKDVALTLVWYAEGLEKFTTPINVSGSVLEPVGQNPNSPIIDTPTSGDIEPATNTQSGLLNNKISFSGFRFFGLAMAQEVPTSTNESVISAPPSSGTEGDLQKSGAVPDAETPSLSEAKTSDTFLKVSYSLNGESWEELVQVNPYNWKDLTISLPIKSWEDLRKLQISIEGVSNSLPELSRVFLDGMLLGVKYDLPAVLVKEERKEIQSPAGDVKIPDNLPFIVLPEGKKLKPSELDKKDFGPNESPNFDLDLDELQVSSTSSSYYVPPRFMSRDPAVASGARVKKSNLNKLAGAFLEFTGLNFSAKADSGVSPGEVFLNDQNPIIAQVVDSKGAPTDIQPFILTVNNKLRVSVPEPKRSFRPGKYKLKVWVLRNSTVYFSEAEYVWGVLAIDFNKSIYKKGDQGKMGLAVLDDNGHTVCDADVRVRVIAPSGVSSEFSTRNQSLIRSPTCGPDNITDEADYFAFFPTEEVGTYNVQATVESQDGLKTVGDGFQVQEDPAFEIERLGPVRILPTASYRMTLRVKSRDGFRGEISELLPLGFSATSENYADQFEGADAIEIKWRADLAAGETRDFSYNFKAPEISPILYKLGAASISESGGQVFLEFRQWQIASDAVTNDGSLIAYGDTADTGDPLNLRWLTATSTWGAESTTTIPGSTDIEHVVVKAAPTRNEFTAGYLMVDGRLDFSVVSSTTWKRLFNATSSATQVCNATLGSCNQTFDLAYEQLSGRALMVYGSPTTDGVINYVTWDGTATSSVSTFTFNNGSTQDTAWVRLVPKGAKLTDQRSNEMMLLLADGGNKLFGAYWDGTQFLASTTLQAMPTSGGLSRPFDGAWETNSGNFIAVYASSSAGIPTSDFFAYRKFSAGSWGNPMSAGNFGTGIDVGAGYWVAMDADPLSNRLAAGFEYLADAEIAPFDSEGIWKSDGATEGWTIVSTTSTLESTAAFGQVQAAWERFGSGNSTSSALFTYNVFGTVDTAAYRTWISGTGFGAGTDIPTGWSNDGNYRKLIPSPNDDEMMWVGVDSDNDLNAQRWDGSNWGSTSTEMNTAVGTSTNTNAGFENNAFDFAYKMYSPWSLNWRWYTGTSTVDTPSPALAAENTSTTISSSSMKLRLRFNVAELGGNGQTDVRKKLQFTTSTSPDASSTVWTDVGNVGSSTIWRYFDCSTGDTVCDDGGVVAATVLSSSTNAGWWNTSNNAAAGTNMDHASTTVRELEFPIEGNSATAGFTYYFRMYDVGQQSPVYRQQTSWPATPCAGNFACTYPSIVLSVSMDPVVTLDAFNGGNSITLITNTTSTIYVNFTVADNSGCSDVFTNGNTTTTIYRSGLSNTCTADSRNCYRVSTSTNNCGAGTSANATSTFDVYYFADATDADSSYAAQSWFAMAEARDSTGATSSATSSVELNTLTAINVTTSSVNYGSMTPSSTTGLVNQTVSVQNAGNSSSSIGVSGTALTSGSNKIATSSQHYASSTFYFGGSEGVLSGTATTISGVTLNPRITNATNTVSAWTDTTALPEKLTEATAAAYNGYLYNFGGLDNTNFVATSTVFYAQINSNGTIGSWSTTQAMPSVLYQQAAAIYNGYVYMIGGSDGSVNTTTVSYAQFSSNGTLGSWSNTTALPTAIRWHAAAAGTNGYLYVTGGNDGTVVTSTVFYAQINSNGTIGSWTTTTVLPNISSYHQTVINKGFIYNIPSFYKDTVPKETSTVVYAPLQSSGTIGAWTKTTELPFTLFKQKSVVLGDYIYNIAGKENTTDTGIPTQTVRVGTIASNGTISAWDSTTDFPTGLIYHSVAAWNGYLYVLGGQRGSANNPTSTVKYGTVNNGNSQKDTFWGAGPQAVGAAPTGTYSGVNTFTASYAP